MNRYLLTYSKKGNIRFVSHLDMQRLFKLILIKAEIDVAYSNGFNPHTRTNIVQPLSSGFEAERDYFEFETNAPQNQLELLAKLNANLPQGLFFTGIREIPVHSKYSTPLTESSEYLVYVPCKITKEALANFASRPEVYITKRDKKTKTMVEKNVKPWIYNLDVSPFGEGSLISMLVRCAANEAVNPAQLAESLLSFCVESYIKEDIRVTRTEIYIIENGTRTKLFEAETL